MGLPGVAIPAAMMCSTRRRARRLDIITRTLGAVS
jgi:hypothetical protein